MSKIEELSIDQLCDKIESHGDAQYSARNEIKIRFADLELKLIDETALRMSHEGHIDKLERQLVEAQAEAAKGNAAVKAMEKISIVLDFYNSSDEIKEMIVKVNNKYQEAVCQK